MSRYKPTAANKVPAEINKTVYPDCFRHIVEGRSKRKIGNFFNLQNFGVNYTELAPGSSSALKHYHKTQDEFIYIIAGEATLLLNEEKITMKAGDCMGFAKGKTVAHQLKNESNAPVTYLEIGDRTDGDEVCYPDDDLKAMMVDGHWQLSHKDGRPW